MALPALRFPAAIQHQAHRLRAVADGELAADRALLFSDAVMAACPDGRWRRRPDIRILPTSGLPDKAGDARGRERKEQVLGKP